jgi:hypothetical protein
LPHAHRISRPQAARQALGRVLGAVQTWAAGLNSESACEATLNSGRFLLIPRLFWMAPWARADLGDSWTDVHGDLNRLKAGEQELTAMSVVVR